MTKEEKKEKKKRKKLKWQVKLILIVLIIIIYAFFIGPKGIFVKEYKVSTNKIPDKMEGLKILQISDLHYGSTVNINDVKEIRKKANETKSDIVIFTGDLMDKTYNIKTNEKEELKKELSKINAELGKYYVLGEDDSEDDESILNISGFTNLNNNPQSIYNEDNTPILLMDKSVSDDYLNSEENINHFKILAVHNPDDFNKFMDNNLDMVIAGHTHNGQINIPKIKDLFISSKYNKSYQKINNTKLYVNPGIGTSGVKIRLFNHPTMFLYRMNKTSTK